MSLLSQISKALVKPIRWATSSLSGQKGRDLIDQNEGLITEVLEQYLEDRSVINHKWNGFLSVADPHYSQFVKPVVEGDGFSKADATILAKEVTRRAMVEIKKEALNGQ